MWNRDRLKKLVFGTVAIAVIATAILARRWGQETTENSDCFGICWAEGKSRAFNISVSSQLVSGETPPQEQIGLKGKLDIQMLSRSPRLIRLVFSGDVTGIPESMKPTLVTELFHDPVLFELGPRGEPIATRGTEQTRAHFTQVWASLLWAMQYSPAENGQSQWTATESDALGTFQATYHRRNNKMVEKQRLRYTSSRLKQISFNIHGSEIAFETDPGGNLARFTLNERVESLKNGPMPGFAGQYTYSIEKDSDSDVERWRDVRDLAMNQPASPAPTAEVEESSEALDDQRIQGRKMPDVLARLIEADSSGNAESAETGREYVALTALLRRDVDALSMAREHIKAGGPLVMTLIEALRDAGTPAAQTLLVEVLSISPKVTPAQRLEVARSLGRVERPTPENIAALKEMRAEPGFGQQARYGLGSAVFRLKQTDPELARITLGDLVSELKQTQDDSVRVMDLIALGNAGHPESSTSIAPFLKSGSESVRASAAQALRRIEGIEADNLLVAAAQDSSSSVRYNVANAISEREETTLLVGVVCKLAVSESDFKTRAEAVRTASNWFTPGKTDLFDSLQHVAMHDSSPDLRAIAQRALSRNTATR